jgi:myosin heavy subunit
MSVIGLNGEEQQNVLQLTAAILHLGNITFVEDRSNTASVQDDQCNNNLYFTFHILPFSYSTFDQTFYLQRLGISGLFIGNRCRSTQDKTNEPNL